MSRYKTKLQRLEQIEAELFRHPEGLTQAELARRLGCNRSTIYRSLADLHTIYPEGNKLLIDRQAYLVNLRLNLHEALAIHLAGRMMATRLDRQDPHAASAFYKLGVALEHLAPQISQCVLGSAAVFAEDSKRQDSKYLVSLEQITLAWAGSQKVHLWHRSTEGNGLHEYIFCTYYIEVNAVGQAVYAIGKIEPEGQMRTFKLERIERLEILPEGYAIPEDFDAAELFKQAWGIWYTDQEPVEVVLRFSPQVAARVKETRWHPSEQMSDNEDGSLVWRAEIAEPREMVPWIRGWGADVEVLAPQALRERIGEEARAMARLYTDEFESDL